MANVCFNRRVVDSRFDKAGNNSFSQTRKIDPYLPSTDPRLIDVNRSMYLTLDSIPLSGFVSEELRYLDSKDTPQLGWTSREKNHSSWQYYLTEDQSKPFNPIIYGNNYKATLSEFQDPMGCQKTEYILQKPKEFIFNDLQDEQNTRLNLQSKIQSKMDEQKFGPKFILSRKVTSQTLF